MIPPEITPVSVAPQRLVPVRFAPFKFALVKSAPGPTRYPFAMPHDAGREIGLPISFEERIPFRTELAKFVLEMFVPESKLFERFAEFKFKFERSMPDKSVFERSELGPSRKPALSVHELGTRGIPIIAPEEIEAKFAVDKFAPVKSAA